MWWLTGSVPDFVCSRCLRFKSGIFQMVNVAKDLYIIGLSVLSLFCVKLIL